MLGQGFFFSPRSLVYLLSDLFLSLPFCLCVDILRAWTQNRMAQPGKVLARGLFIFIMLVLEKLWKPASLCSRMVWFFCLGGGGYLCSSLCYCACYAAVSLQRRRASTEASWWAPVHCRQANMVEMRSVTEPRTETHRWLTMIEGCPLSAAPRELLTETLNPLTMMIYYFSQISSWTVLVTLLNSRILVNLYFVFVLFIVFHPTTYSFSVSWHVGKVKLQLIVRNYFI